MLFCGRVSIQSASLQYVERWTNVCKYGETINLLPLERAHTNQGNWAEPNLCGVN